MTVVGYIALFLLVILVLALIAFYFLTEYIWMDSLGFETIFTTILGNKILLVSVGFLLFGVSSFFTLYWIRRSYLSHFDPVQLPKMMLERKKMMLIMIGISIVI